MPETLIFHHRYTSPFSEKIRLMLGYLGASWQSVHAPFYPPRPGIDPLVNGYRQIPVAQVGADVFCDTRMIADEIARLHDHQELSPFHCTPDVAQYLAEIETKVFYCCVRTAPPTGALGMMVRKVPFWHWPGYIRDKIRITKISTVSIPPKEEATGVWNDFLADLNEKTSKSSFLFGNDKPTIADFTAFHPVWFHVDMGAKILANRPSLRAWYDRVMAFGHGRLEQITTRTSLAAAQNNVPRSVPEEMTQGKHIGQTVEIAPAETMKIPTGGQLVGENDVKWILRRDSDFGTPVHVHFPKEFYQLTPVSPKAS